MLLFNPPSQSDCWLACLQERIKASPASMALDNKTRSADPQIFLLELFAGFYPIKIEHAASSAVSTR